MPEQAPSDITAERQVLGALMIRPVLLNDVSTILHPDEFYSNAHRIIYKTIIDIFQKGDILPDPLQIIQKLKDKENIIQAGGEAYIMKLAEDVIAPSNALVHTERIKSLALRRDLINEAQLIAEEAKKPVKDENAFLKKIEDRILSLTSRKYSGGVVPVIELKEQFKEQIVSMMKGDSKHEGQLTYFHQLDDITGGFKGGELIILAARPSVGKTTLAMNIASNITLKGRKNVLVFSLEMSKSELLLRLVCSEAQLNLKELKARGKSKIPPDKYSDVLTAVEHIFSSPLYIDDTGTLEIYDLMSRARKLSVELEQKGESLSLIIIDYLQLIIDPASRKLGRQYEIAAISRALKQLAKATDTPVLAISQLNRSVEQRRTDTKPLLSDIRESGAIEQDADIVIFIHKPTFKDPESPEALESRNSREIIIAKHRNGPVDEFKLAFRPVYNRFDNYDAPLSDSFQ